jgi:hypothetical protein
MPHLGFFVEQQSQLKTLDHVMRGCLPPDLDTGLL